MLLPSTISSCSLKYYFTSLICDLRESQAMEHDIDLYNSAQTAAFTLISLQNCHCLYIITSFLSHNRSVSLRPLPTCFLNPVHVLFQDFRSTINIMMLSLILSFYSLLRIIKNKSHPLLKTFII